jgi:hypothetical protein
VGGALFVSEVAHFCLSIGRRPCQALENMLYMLMVPSTNKIAVQKRDAYSITARA